MTEAETRLDFRSAFGFWICSFWLICISLFSASAQAAFSHQLQPIALTDVRWTHGFWADRQEVCRTNTIPALWSIMNGTNYTHFLQNFRIAAGRLPVAIAEHPSMTETFTNGSKPRAPPSRAQRILRLSA